MDRFGYVQGTVRGGTDRLSLEQLRGLLDTFFFLPFLCLLNIIVSGHLLGYVFKLPPSGEGVVTVRLPFFVNFPVRGKRAVAGLASFAVTLAIVALWLSEPAYDMFVENTAITTSQATASTGLAATLSVAACLVLLFFRGVGEIGRYLIQRNKRKEATPAAQPTPAEQAEKVARHSGGIDADE